MNRYVLALILVLTLAGIAAGRSDDHRDIRRTRAVPTATATPAPQATQPGVSLEHAPAADPFPTCVPNAPKTDTPAGPCVIESITRIYSP
jgi:hypothetical protein